MKKTGDTRDMSTERKAAIAGLFGVREDLLTTRTGLVRLPEGVDSTLFGGWGVRI